MFQVELWLNEWLYICQKSWNIEIQSKRYWNICSTIIFRSCFKNLSFDNIKETGLYGYVYGFSVNYKSIDVLDILDIQQNLMKKRNIK